MKKYSIHLLSGVFFVLTIVAIFNWLINPYDIFQSPAIEGFNQYKSEAGRHTRLTKVYQVEKVRPEAILLASSRGLVIPESYFSGETMTAYNMSLASASTYELFRMLQHAQAVKPLKRVVLALDELITEQAQSNFSENRLLVKPDGSVNGNKWFSRLQDYFSSMLSVDALRSSMRTLRKQNEDLETMDPKRYASNRISNAGGHRQMFRTMESDILSDAIDSVQLCRNPGNTNVNTETESVESFVRIVDFAYSNNIELYIYFSPVHARLYEVSCMAGLWNKIENVKKAVVSIVEKKAKIYAKNAYPVWDFSGYNSITMEDVPELGDRTSLMKWYWEGSHYTKETAKVVLDKIFSKSDLKSDFGVHLTTGNIDSHLLDIRRQRDKYIRSHAEDVVELQFLLENAVIRRKVFHR